MNAVESACPSCGVVATRMVYDIGSGPELSCANCEWCWGAEGQPLKPLHGLGAEGLERDAEQHDRQRADDDEHRLLDLGDVGGGAVSQPIPVEVRSCTDPEGRRAVLMQFTHGYLILRPAQVRQLCARLLDCADEVDADG